MRTYLLPLYALLFLALAGSALAGDGRVEISQAGMEAGGITPGDAPGPPVSLNVQGSYVFTSDLLTTDPNQDMVVIAADHVTIDMNGFKIQGPTTCTTTEPTPPGQPETSCTQTGTGSGVTDLGVTRKALTITNGRFTGLGEHCIDNLATEHAFVERCSCDNAGDHGMRFGCCGFVGVVQVDHVGGDAIVTGDWSYLDDVSTVQSGGNGLVTGSDSQVFESRSTGNVENGFVLDGGSTLHSSIGSKNGGSGANVICGGTRVTDSVFNRNQDDGIRTTQNGGALDCAIHGVTASGNAGNALQVVSPQGIQPNILLDIVGFNAAGNALFGLALPLSCPPGVPCATVRDSNLMRNAGGTISGSFIEAPDGSNVCEGNTICP